MKTRDRHLCEPTDENTDNQRQRAQIKPDQVLPGSRKPETAKDSCTPS